MEVPKRSNQDYDKNFVIKAKVALANSSKYRENGNKVQIQDPK